MTKADSAAAAGIATRWFERNTLGLHRRASGWRSATTVLVASTLRWMHGAASGLDLYTRKLLGFTDNGQDAALQAGHFNDFPFVSLIRAGFLGALQDAGSKGLRSDELGVAQQRTLGFDRPDPQIRAEWLLEHYSHIRIDAKRQALDALDAARRGEAGNGDAANGNGEEANAAEIATIVAVAHDLTSQSRHSLLLQGSPPSGKLLIPLARRDVRVVEGARLESVCRGNSTVGSNPTLSATP